MFSEIIMEMGKYFPCKWGKNWLFQESFEKNPPEVTPILYIESNRNYVEKLCEKKRKNRNIRDKYGYGKVFSLQMEKK
jgi:hypothetical protein